MITIAAIQKAVAAHYGLEHADITGPSRARSIAQPRQVAMYLSRRLANKTYPQLGRAFGGRNHTTIIHGVEQVRPRLADRAMRRDVVRILRGLGQ